jgi:hypothetical protein
MSTFKATTAAADALSLAASPDKQLYELAFCAVTGQGLKFAIFSVQRKRFTAREHAVLYAVLNPPPHFFHWALLYGTPAEVAAHDGMMSRVDLANYDDPDMDECDDCRFAVAVCDASGKRVLNTVDGETMRFKTRKQAEIALEGLKAHVLLPQYASTGHALGIVEVNGMDDAIDDTVVVKRLKKRWNNVIMNQPSQSNNSSE